MIIEACSSEYFGGESLDLFKFSSSTANCKKKEGKVFIPSTNKDLSRCVLGVAFNKSYIVIYEKKYFEGVVF